MSSQVRFFPDPFSTSQVLGLQAPVATLCLQKPYGKGKLGFAKQLIVSLSYSTLKVLVSAACRGKRKSTTVQGPTTRWAHAGVSGQRSSQRDAGWSPDGSHTVVKEIDRPEVSIKACPCEGEVGERQKKQEDDALNTYFTMRSRENVEQSPGSRRN